MRFPKINSIWLYLTGRCNLNCVYCFEKGDSSRQRGSMKKTVAQKAVRFLINETEKKGMIGFFGGEPLIKWGLIRETIQYAEKMAERKNKQLRFFIITNGTLLDKRKAEFLIRHNVGVRISFDSHLSKIHDFLRPYKNGKGSFGDVMRAINLFKGTKLLSISSTLTPANVQFFEFFKFLTRLKWIVSINFILSISADRKMRFSSKDIKSYQRELEKYVLFLKQNWMRGEIILPHGKHLARLSIMSKTRKGIKVNPCPAGRTEVGIDHQGNIYACELLIGNPRFHLGTIFEGMDPQKRKTLLARVPCRACEVKDNCHGGCFFCASCLKYPRWYTMFRKDCQVIRNFLSYLGSVM